jgi:hypothetical protein
MWDEILKIILAQMGDLAKRLESVVDTVSKLETGISHALREEIRQLGQLQGELVAQMRADYDIMSQQTLASVASINQLTLSNYKEATSKATNTIKEAGQQASFIYVENTKSVQRKYLREWWSVIIVTNWLTSVLVIFILKISHFI